jgi:hypothetical protein
MSHTNTDPPLSEALTLNGGPSCASPFCEGTARQIRKHGRYCSDRCRMDGYVLRRAKEMIERVGIGRFNAIIGTL